VAAAFIQRARVAAAFIQRARVAAAFIQRARVAAAAQPVFGYSDGSGGGTASPATRPAYAATPRASSTTSTTPGPRTHCPAVHGALARHPSRATLAVAHVAPRDPLVVVAARWLAIRAWAVEPRSP
jgi:hypothetical protein